MRSIWLGLLVSVSALGCASDEPLVFVGEVENTDSRFGFVIDGDEGRIYVCGGEVDRTRHHDWFDVTSADGATFEGTEGQDSIRLDVDGDVVSGSVTIDDDEHTLTGTRASGEDGLYAPAPEDEKGDCRLGVVVAEAGAVIQGVFCDQTVGAVQVVPIDFDTVDAAVEGFTVASETAQPFEFSVLPVSMNP
ncbi:MAG: hypothetical protein AAGA48_40425 [Myxococcota bacterium]